MRGINQRGRPGSPLGRTGRTDRRAASRRNRAAFTLVELLVVISIIVILLGILLPALTTAVSIARTAETRSRVTALGEAVHQFQAENDYFPGQNPKDDNALLTAGSGSAFLGKALFVGTDESGEPVFPSEKYLGYKEGFAAPEDDWGPNDYEQYTLLDGMKQPMAICYYPSLPGREGLDQYNEADNEQYTDGHKGGDFDEFIEDPRFESSRPYNSGEFLLIAPGSDREYFTPDDVTNW